MIRATRRAISGFKTQDGVPLIAVAGYNGDSKGVLYIGRSGDYKFNPPRNNFFDEKKSNVSFLTNNTELYDYLIEPESLELATEDIKKAWEPIGSLLESLHYIKKGIKIMEKDTVFLRMGRKFVKENLDGKDGKTFNVVTLPKGTTINGQDVSGFTFNPLFVQDDKFVKNCKTIPLLEDKEVWLKKVQRDDKHNPIKDDSGKAKQTIIKVMPIDIKNALQENYKRYKELQTEKDKQETEVSGVDNDIDATVNERVTDFTEQRYGYIKDGVEINTEKKGEAPFCEMDEQIDEPEI